VIVLKANPATAFNILETLKLPTKNKLYETENKLIIDLKKENKDNHLIGQAITKTN